MSGPKSASYTITAELRNILKEAMRREREIRRERDKLERYKNELMRRERETRRERDKLEQYKNELVILKDNLESATNSVDMFVERYESGKKEQTDIHDLLVRVQIVVQKTGEINIQSGLEELQSINSKIHTFLECAKKAMDLFEGQSNEIAEKLSADIEDSISAGMMIRMEEEIVTPMNHIEVQQEKINDILNSALELDISSELRNEGIEILKKAQEISNNDFIDNYYAMTVLPYTKKCKRYNEQVKEYGEEFEELISMHRYYSEYLGIPVMQFAFSMDKMETLKQEVKELEKRCEALEEQRYISESFDEVMRDMGYHVIGSRNKIKKSGRKFHNKLYQFSEGSAVNITYAADGQISMELGGVDTCDREPTKAEGSALCDEMSEFCDDFQEIEKRLKEKGVVLANRISMLPPVEEYAQIINISDYDMTEQVANYEVISKKQSENKKQVIRRE